MDDWAKVVTEVGATIYINPTAGKFVHEVGTSSITSLEEFKSTERERGKKEKEVKGDQEMKLNEKDQ